MMDSQSHVALTEKHRRVRPPGRPWLRLGARAQRCVLALAAMAGVMHLAAITKTTSCVVPMAWTRCPAEYPASLECGKLTVPMDYNNRGGGRITLGMVRLRSNASRSLGNLVLNPGGPGTSVVDMFVRRREHELVSQALRDHFNIVAPDSRGVGVSNPVLCDAGLFNRRVHNYVTGKAGLARLEKENKARGESCASRTGQALHHVDTASAARDLDQIRQALGDRKLNFLGISYGTQLGSQYAELFPETVGRMVLDGVLDHSQNEVDSLMTEVTTFEDNLNRFFSWCNSTADCPFQGQDLPSIFDKLVDDANEKPLAAPACFEPDSAVPVGGRICRPNVTGYELIRTTQELVSDWPVLARALLEASRRNNATLLSPALVHAAPNATVGGGAKFFSHAAIGCQDWLRGGDLPARLMAARALAPHTRGVCEMLGIQASCVGWPTPVANPQRPLSLEQMLKAPPILLVNAFHDPSTSVVWAVGLRGQMPRAVSIFRNGYGHTSYDRYGETQRAMDTFLIHGSGPTDLAVFDS